MDRGNSKRLAYLAAGLASLTGLVHLLVGLRVMYGWIATGELGYVLGPVFLLAGIAIFGGLAFAYYRPAAVRPIYASGIVLSTLLLVGYVDWHVTGVAESALGLEEYTPDHGAHGSETGGHHGDNGHGGETGDHHGDHDHGGHDEAGHADESAVSTLIDHLSGDPVALASKVAELALLPLLGLLYARSE